MAGRVPSSTRGILLGVLVIVAGWSFGPLSRVFGTSRVT